ncbi:hypothetical protein IP69_18010 [Bosea sp. AAP35]|uniref:EF-hand domain-containing protein n=1 Tax=Bosea sp. AAP35 TaxID=1523417 RepID=UPI0006B9DC67|nr:EF-hand domain-containing protein [Bosea sp. AAP35]KPF64718.1 hypothetical protein IP69_18010 [Bosea sp. AAP35]
MSSISSVSGGYRPPPPKSSSFETLDTDTSGGLSVEEFKAGTAKGAGSSRSEELFKAIDSDSDGSVTQEETEAFKAKAEQAQRQLQSFLIGLQSGGSSETESDEETDIFAQIDTDSDGGISSEEFLSAFSSGTNSSGTSSSDDLLSKLFEAIDSNADGSVTKEEQSDFQAAMEKRGPPSGPPPSSASSSASQAYGNTHQLGAANTSGTAYSQAA